MVTRESSWSSKGGVTDWWEFHCMGCGIGRGTVAGYRCFESEEDAKKAAKKRI
ncbi:MAG: hypothetical protein GWN00_06090 [Aliifodinibius sp.]|nr:hypothetical protein [Fodinibius sp.]NIY24389.1 hypothetical protein [Fodinibius sp.]